PTGITLDNMPYIILMAVALVGLGAFALRKRAQN
ncbi:MAG: LPXTG cell wall anchor domain-containing protein, partial [Tissierellia bacterium]|nr:LPXTG cell wall anchor domain-containing protein [Tissierellia bacterium]